MCVTALYFLVGFPCLDVYGRSLNALNMLITNEEDIVQSLFFVTAVLRFGDYHVLLILVYINRIPL